MRTYCLIFNLFSSIFAYAQYGAYNFTFLGKWNNPNMPKSSINQQWSDLTGYYDSINKREYVIAGGVDSIYFFDVTDPTNIKLCDVEDGKSKRMINRDMECFSHYVYCVSDNGEPGSLQIFDLSYLPDSVFKVYDSDTLAANTHTVFINVASKRLYMVGNRLKGGGLSAIEVVSLENPEVPVRIGRLNIPRAPDGAPFFRTVHEIFVKNDTVYASAEWYGLWIFDMNDLNNQRLLGVIANYPQNGYNHNSWLSPDGTKIVFTDEIPQGLPLKIFDITNLANARLISMFGNNNVGRSTPHNPFWIGDFIYVSYYHDGLYVFDAKDPRNVTVAGWFYTSPMPPPSYQGFAGNWGLYPFFPSGNIALIDMQEGLYMVKPDKEITSDLPLKNLPLPVKIFPNPVQNQLNINIPIACKYQIMQVNGQIIESGFVNNTVGINTQNLTPGVYFIQFNPSGYLPVTQKFIKQ
jgi:choice-of-anchor B domain-containing protein